MNKHTSIEHKIDIFYPRLPFWDGKGETMTLFNLVKRGHSSAEKNMLL